MSPSGRTTSNPSTSSRVLPNFSTLTPPALVEMLPPIMQEPCAPKLSGKKQPASLAACWTFCRITPASTVMVMPSASICHTRFIRSSDKTRVVLFGQGVAPPQRPVCPPCGTIPMPCSLQYLTMAETSSTDEGLATPIQEPENLVLQSIV